MPCHTMQQKQLPLTSFVLPHLACHVGGAGFCATAPHLARGCLSEHVAAAAVHTGKVSCVLEQHRGRDGKQQHEEVQEADDRGERGHSLQDGCGDTQSTGNIAHNAPCAPQCLHSKLVQACQQHGLYPQHTSRKQTMMLRRDSKRAMVRSGRSARSARSARTAPALLLLPPIGMKAV